MAARRPYLIPSRGALGHWVKSPFATGRAGGVQEDPARGREALPGALVDGGVALLAEENEGHRPPVSRPLTKTERVWDEGQFGRRALGRAGLYAGVSPPVE